MEANGAGINWVKSKLNSSALKPDQYGNAVYSLLDGEAFKLVEDDDPDDLRYVGAEQVLR